MPNTKKSNAYLDRTIDAYRGAVKSWSRDVVIVLAVFIVSGLFTVFPFIHWSSKESAIQAKLADKTAQQKQIAAVMEDIKNIQSEFDRERHSIDSFGQDVATELSNRLSSFSRAVQSLKQEEPRLSSEPFPGALSVEQFARPSSAPLAMDPRTLLAMDYGLSNTQIDQLISADADVLNSASWNKVKDMAMSVFQNEIARSYERLNDRVREGYQRLQAYAQTTLDTVYSAVNELGIALSDTSIITLRFEPITPPADDKLFRTRAGKFAAMESETNRIDVNIDATIAPLRLTLDELTNFSDRLNRNIARLQTEQHKAEKVITTLESQFKDSEQHLAQISLPLKWLPLEITTFIHLYPTFFAVLLALLIYRFQRLSKLRTRLSSELKAQGLGDDDFQFALSVPDALIDVFSDSEAKVGSVRRWLSIQIVILLFLIGSIIYIEVHSLNELNMASIFNLLTLSCTVGGLYLIYKIKQKQAY